jgi:hypothetical protein
MFEYVSPTLSYDEWLKTLSNDKAWAGRRRPKKTFTQAAPQRTGSRRAFLGPEERREYRRTPEGRVKLLAEGAIQREKQKGKNTTTVRALIDSLRPFPTHCPLTGVELSYAGSGSIAVRHPNAASIDQIIPGAGYGNNNARIVALRINVILSNSSAERHRALEQKHLTLAQDHLIAAEDRLRTEQLIQAAANDAGPEL